MPKQSQSYARPYAALAVLCTATFVASLDLFIVNVAFNAIGHDYHSASQSDLSWVLNGYAIVFAALLVPAGRLADRFGRRAAFLLGLACSLPPAPAARSRRPSGRWSASAWYKRPERRS